MNSRTRKKRYIIRIRTLKRHAMARYLRDARKGINNREAYLKASRYHGKHYRLTREAQEKTEVADSKVRIGTSMVSRSTLAKFFGWNKPIG